MNNLSPETVLATVAAAPDAVVIVDRAGVICYWNSGAERIFGHAASEMIGSGLDVIIPERLRQRHNEGFRTAVARGWTKYGDSDLLAVPALAADGRTLSIEFSVVLLRDAAGSVDHVGAIIRDVTERWARDREMHRRLQELTGGDAPA